MNRLNLLLCTVLLPFLQVVQAQSITNPTPQPLPYNQNFDVLPPTSTTFPVGWQGCQRHYYRAAADSIVYPLIIVYVSKYNW